MVFLGKSTKIISLLELFWRLKNYISRHFQKQNDQLSIMIEANAKKQLIFTIPTLQWPNFGWQWIHCSDFEAQPWLTKKTRKTPEKIPGKPWVTKKTRKNQRKNTWPIIQVQFRCQQCRDKSLFGQAMDDRWQQKRQTIFFIREGVKNDFFLNN